MKSLSINITSTTQATNNKQHTTHNMNNPRQMKSAQIMAAIQNGADLTQYDYVLAKIKETTDVFQLQAMLLDTLENAKNAGELADDLFEFYL